MRHKASVQSVHLHHVMDDQRDDGRGFEPTLVMGASIVMEWIRAIDECLLWEPPDRVKKYHHHSVFK